MLREALRDLGINSWWDGVLWIGTGIAVAVVVGGTCAGLVVISALAGLL